MNEMDARNSIRTGCDPLHAPGTATGVVGALSEKSNGIGTGRFENLDGSEGRDTEKAEGCQIVTLPWPPKELSPNSRIHWASLAKAKKLYRGLCGWHAMTQGIKKANAGALHLTLTFHAPSRRAYDLDNALARMKSGLDGLADVLGVDDSKWTLTIRKADEIGGFVRVEVSEC